MDDDLPIDNGLTSMRAKIYGLLPAGWTLYGPITQRDGTFKVGCRPMNGPVEEGCFAVHENLVSAFRLLADGIRALDLPPGLSN